MTERRSADARVPGYRVDLEPSAERVRARVGDLVVAESDRALVVRETGHEPVVYFPRDDVRLALFERTTHATHCPFKGDASYWTLRSGARVEENVAWSYESPFDEVAGIAGFLAFYGDRVRCAPVPAA